MTHLRLAVRLGLLLLVLVMLAAVQWQSRRAAPVLAGPNVFGGPVNGACYLATPTSCRIRIDQWAPIGDAGQRLAGFRLAAQAAGAGAPGILYDFRTDVSNPPGGGYQPSPVALDFAARCDVTYELTLQAQDTDDVSFVELGRTNAFACPAAAVTENYLPLIRR